MRSENVTLLAVETKKEITQRMKSGKVTGNEVSSDMSRDPNPNEPY